MRKKSKGSGSRPKRGTRPNVPLAALFNTKSDELAGKELQKFRKDELDLSQRGLAHCLGVSVRTVQGWEVGKSRPLVPIVRLIKLFKFIPSVKRLLCSAPAESKSR